MFEIVINQLDDQERNSSIISLDRYSKASSRILKSQIKNLFEFQKSQFKKLEEIQKDINMSDENEDYENLIQGHLVMMSCGHRGIPCRTEEKRVSRLLRKSGFIPMLEALHLQQTS